MSRPTYHLVIEYQGSRYRGWQAQQNARSVAGEILRALGELGLTDVELGGSGRTDAGVHALAQHAHLRLGRPRDPRRLRAELNGLLPADIQILSVEPASPRFHARHDAKSRSYLYQVSRRATAFFKPFVWWVREDLDLASMAAAARRFEGLHDFELLCRRPQDQKSTKVAVERVEVAAAGSLVLVRVTASHFVWNQVRRMVGTLVEVGAGRLPAEAVSTLLEGRLPPGVDDPGRWTAPYSGLFLESVRYAGDPPPGPLRPVTPVDQDSRENR